MTASNYTIQQSDSIKILGIHYTKTFDNTKNFNTIISKVSYRLNTIKGILAMAPIKTKVIVSTSLLISIIRYGAGRMTNLTDNQISKINSLMLRISRYILGIRSYRMSTSNIFKELGWLSYPQIITSEAIKVIYNINNMCKPRSMMKFFQFDNVLYGQKRLVRTPSLKHKPNLARTCKSQLFRGTYWFSKLPYEIRVSTNKNFKTALKRHINVNSDIYKLDRPIT